MPLTRRNLVFLLTLALFLTLIGTLHAGDFRIELISVYNDGTFGRGYNPSVSYLGERIVFDSNNRLAPADTNSYHDIFMRDRATNQTILVSMSASGAPGNGNSYLPTISSNGRYVVFYSFATNLAPGDTPSQMDVFRRDLQTGENTAIAPVNHLYRSRADITPDGRYVVFASEINNLVAGDTNGHKDIFRYDHATGQLALVSATSGGAPGSNHSDLPVISADGRYVFFQSQANDLVAGDTNLTIDIFRRDMQSSEIVRVSLSSANAQGNGASQAPSISADGRYVAFHTQAGNFASIPLGGTQVIVRDMQTGQNTLASISLDGLAAANGVSQQPELSADGRFVAFQSAGTNLVAVNSSVSYLDVYVRDLQAGVTTQVNLTSAGVPPDSSATTPAISPDGYFIAFETSAALIPNADWYKVYMASNIFLPNVSPSNAAPVPGYTDSLPTKLTWNSISWAQEYEVQVANNAALSGASSYFVAAGTLEYNLTSVPNGTYYWRVRARNAADVWGDWSAAQTLEIAVD